MYCSIICKPKCRKSEGALTRRDVATTASSEWVLDPFLSQWKKRYHLKIVLSDVLFISDDKFITSLKLSLRVNDP